MDSKLILSCYCQRGHALKEHIDTGSYLCNVCNIRYTNAERACYSSYECKGCNYTTCDTCYNKALEYCQSMQMKEKPKADKIIKQGLVCQAGHLFESSFIKANYQCVMCKNKSSVMSLSCSENCTTICLDCADILLDSQLKRNQSKDIQKDIRCDAGHLLIKVFKVYSANRYNCNICYRESITSCTTEGVYHCDPCGFDVCPYCETNSQSCEAEGFYMQNQTKYPMKSSFVIYSNGTIKGFSTDTVGKATWKGIYANGDCELTKKYIGKHKVKYFGKLDDNKIVGTWKLSDFNGAFEFMFSPTFFSQFPKITLKLEEPIVKEEGVFRVEKQEEKSIYLKESVRGGDANLPVSSHFNPLPNTTDNLDFNYETQKRRESSCDIDHYQNSMALKPKQITTPNLRVSSCFLC